MDYEGALWSLIAAMISEFHDILRPSTPEHREHVQRVRRDWEITVDELKAGLRPGTMSLGVVTEPAGPGVRFVKAGH